MKVDLHTYFRSSCSARLRIALNLKLIPYTPIFVHLLKDEQFSDSHGALNPSRSVPVLVVHKSSDSETGSGSSPDTNIVIPQSFAALEYLEEISPDRPLLPSDTERRALVRTLVNIIVADIQPVTNMRLQKRVRSLGADPMILSRETTEAGFAAYEAIVSKTAGTFSVGDDITLADVCLVPAAWSAARFDVDIKAYPTIARIVARMEEEDAVKKAHWRNQPDTPEEFR
jgi:maleylacetoacetate isomerase